jgi:hypothetical protein
MEKMPMKGLRREVFYRTNTLVQKGDAFYEIVLAEDADFEGGPFLVKTFHGLAGSPPTKPENSQSFQTLALARDTFDDIARGVEGKGFRLYNSAVHRPDKSF